MTVACLIMASGISRRFGSNKLLADFRGAPLFHRILAATEDLPFCRRLILTRTPEVAKSCREKGIEVILHDLPDRNQAVRLGVETLCGLRASAETVPFSPAPSAILFCPADQPLLTRESICKMLSAYADGIYGPAAPASAEGSSSETPAAFKIPPRNSSTQDIIFRLSFRGTPGAPVLFPAAYFSELCALPPKTGGKAVLNAHPEKVIPVEAGSAEELFDADTPEALKRLE